MTKETLWGPALLCLSAAPILLGCAEHYSRQGCGRLMAGDAGGMGVIVVANTLQKVEGGWEASGVEGTNSRLNTEPFDTGTIYVPSDKVRLVQFDESVCGGGSGSQEGSDE